MTLAEILASGTKNTVPPYLGKRFDAKGRALACSGNTVIGHLHAPARDEFERAVRHISGGPAARCWAWLPVSSYHMTIFDLLQHKCRGPNVWSTLVPADVTPSQADQFMLDLLREFSPGSNPVFRMRVTALEASEAGIWARVEPVSGSENTRIRSLRDDLGRHTGLDHRHNHISYKFHVTLAYAIDWPTVGEAEETDTLIGEADHMLKSALPEFDIGPPEVCLFEDMCAFGAQFVLR